MTPNDFFILKIICRKKNLKIWFVEICRTIFIIPPKLWTFFIFQRLILLCSGKIKELFACCWFIIWWIFLKYYQFSLQYHKQCPTSKIKVKCWQIDQNVFDIFWTCFLQIVSNKLWEDCWFHHSFWSCESDFW